jgi:hypothetical protein
MSQPTGPGQPPEFRPPAAYGGYGGELQSYGQRHASPGSYEPPPFPPPVPWPSQPPPVAQPAAVPVTPAHPAQLPQRPGVVGLAATMAATASLQWVCVLSFLWLVATAGAAQLSTSGVDGGIYHILNRFNYRMLDGLAWPLYLFPVISFVLSFLLLARRSWARLAFTLTGAAAVLWSAWWLRDELLWWLGPAGYIAASVVVLWTGEANRWYAWQPASDARPQQI